MAKAFPQRILIFGGTFDPPHLAHASLPAQAARQLECDEILYIPAAINPLKQKRPPTAPEHRLAMLLLATASVPGAKISTIELDRAGPSYTIDTLRKLKRETKASSKKKAPEFHLLIGCDQALNFHRWKDWREILTLATPAVMMRPPWNLKSFKKELKAAYSPVEAEQWLKWVLRLPEMDICATAIRERLGKGKSTAGLLDPSVAHYIRANRLYR